MKTKVSQMINNNGNAAANQFIITEKNKVVFQSYRTIIAEEHNNGKIVLDSNALDYSRTTSKHLYIFLGLNRKEIEQRIKDKTIKLKNLN